MSVGCSKLRYMYVLFMLLILVAAACARLVCLFLCLGAGGLGVLQGSELPTKPGAAATALLLLPAD